MSNYFGKEIKPLGFGLMRLPVDENKQIDLGKTKKLVNLFMEAGCTYFDTAWAYEGSEEAIKKALVERYPRDFFYLQPSWLHGIAVIQKKMLKISFTPRWREQVQATLTHTFYTILADGKHISTMISIYGILCRRKKPRD